MVIICNIWVNFDKIINARNLISTPMPGFSSPPPSLFSPFSLYWYSFHSFIFDWYLLYIHKVKFPLTPLYVNLTHISDFVKLIPYFFTFSFQFPLFSFFFCSTELPYVILIWLLSPLSFLYFALTFACERKHLTLTLWAWLISLSKIFSSFIHLIANDIISFFFTSFLCSFVEFSIKYYGDFIKTIRNFYFSFLYSANRNCFKLIVRILFWNLCLLLFGGDII